jgi:hypothetical protein
MSTNQIANPDNNTLIVLGATSVLVIGGLAYYFITNKSNEVPKTSQKEIDELMNDQKHPKERRKKNKKNLVQAKNQEENKEEKEEVKEEEEKKNEEENKTEENKKKKKNNKKKK